MSGKNVYLFFIEFNDSQANIRCVHTVINLNHFCEKLQTSHFDSVDGLC